VSGIGFSIRNTQRSIMKLESIIGFLEEFAPPRLAEDWDNVGLLLGDRKNVVSKVMTCLTITPDVIDEAVERQVELIVAHHPMPFRPVKKITTDSLVGTMLWRMSRAGISVYSPHTAFDSAAGGINQLIAEKLQMDQVSPLQCSNDGNNQDHLNRSGLEGAGRQGMLPDAQSASTLCRRLCSLFSLPLIQFCGDLDANVSKIAIGCGSGGQFLADAVRTGCDSMITGEANFHTGLEAIACGVSLFLLSHYGSERFAVEALADILAGEFSELQVWVSQNERDPVQNILSVSDRPVD
jgi:dinuclear metal center YbgI/SA1388 family protein